MTSILRGTRLDYLFDRWEATYPPEQRVGFHRDGAVDEATYYREPRRVLFVQVEPNSRGGAYDRFCGHDLRLVWPQILRKANTVRLAVFAGMALDERLPNDRATPEEVHATLLRLACINLKKLSGTSAAKRAEIAEYSWRDRAFLREQIQILDPHLILAGGPIVQALLGRVLLSDPAWRQPKAGRWMWGNVPVVPCYHPSVRPAHYARAVAALARHLGLEQPSG